jgi:hypothetical protein
VAATLGELPNPHTARATATDTAGNVSTPSSSTRRSQTSPSTRRPDRATRQARDRFTSRSCSRNRRLERSPLVM